MECKAATVYDKYSLGYMAPVPTVRSQADIVDMDFVYEISLHPDPSRENIIFPPATN